MSKYAVSVCVMVVENKQLDAHHTVLVIDAMSADEARGHGYNLAKKTIYPSDEGYFNHDVVVMEITDW